MIECWDGLFSVDIWSSISSMGHMLRDNWFTLGGGDFIVDIGTLDLGDSVAVLHLDWDQLDLGVINTVLSDNLAASVLHCSLDRVSNSMSYWSNNWSSGNRGGVVTSNQVLSISLSLGFSLSLDNVTSSWGITQEVGDLLAHLLVLNLLGVDSLGGADVLSMGGAGLGDQDLNLSLAVGSWNNSSSCVWSSSEQLGVSLGISSWFGSSQSKESRQGNSLEYHCRSIKI